MHALKKRKRNLEADSCSTLQTGRLSNMWAIASNTYTVWPRSHPCEVGLQQRKIIVLHAGLINTKTQQCIHRNGGKKETPSGADFAEQSYKCSQDPMWSTKVDCGCSPTMTGKLDKRAPSHRPSWTLSTDATSFLDDWKSCVCIMQTRTFVQPQPCRLQPGLSAAHQWHLSFTAQNRDGKERWNWVFR